jgi:hypothetical protein
VTRFQNRNRSEADLPVDRERIWEVLTDPGCLAALTPLIRAITADGDTWCWQLSGVSALGVSVAPSFTEQMTFTPVERIVYRHAPPSGTTEKAGAEGVYTLTELPERRCRLFVDLTMWVDLPLPSCPGGPSSGSWPSRCSGRATSSPRTCTATSTSIPPTWRSGCPARRARLVPGTKRAG